MSDRPTSVSLYTLYFLQFLALGSHNGSVHLFDHEGNKVRTKPFRSHDNVTVNQISIDLPGEYFCSCSDDGQVM